MGLTRSSVGGGADSVPTAARREPALETKKASEARTCASVLDRRAEDDDERPGAAVEDDAVGCAWSANQFGEDSDRVLPHMTSRLAALTRELKALEVRYFRTRLQLEKAVEKNHQLRADSAKLRGHSTKLERETCKLRNLIDRIQSEKKQLELQAIHNRDYAKRIEQRFFMGTKGQSIVQCNVELGKQVKALEKLAQERDATIQSQRLALQDAEEKLRILRRALETRFEEMQLNGSLHTGVLFELTRLQDQNASLALQLTHDRKSAKALQLCLADARAKESELDEALVVREAMIGSLERERAVLDDQLAVLRSEQQTSAFEKATLLKFVQEQAEVKFQLDAQVKLVQEAKVAEVTALHHKLQLAMEDKAQVQDALRAASVQCERLQLECHAARSRSEDEQRQSLELQTRAQELELELQRLGDALSKAEDDFKAAREVCRELQSAVGSYELETRELRARIAALEGQQGELRHAIAQKHNEELALRAAMESALRDLETLSTQRNDAAKAMNEAVTISASSLDEQQALEAKIEAQRKQLEQLKHAKSLLQNAMLEQLAALRKQLQLERVQRIEAEAKVKQLFAFSSPRKRSERARPPPRSEQEELRSTTRTHAADREQGSEVAALDAEEPQPLPPPTMTGAPSPLPTNLSGLGRLHHDAHSSPSSSSSSSDSDDDDREAPVQPRPPLTPQIPASSLLAHALEHSPEHRVGHAQLSEAHVSLLELAGGD